MPGFTSKALLANLAETAVREVRPDERHLVLLEAVSGYRGLEKQVEELLREAHHPYRNLRLVLADLRSLALKNLRVILRHERGPQALWVICEIFFWGFGEKKKELWAQAAEGLFSVLEKTFECLSPEDWSRYVPVLSEIFGALEGLPEERWEVFLESYCSFRRLAEKYLRYSPEPPPENLRTLLIKALRMTYQRWLRTVDPARYFPGLSGYSEWVKPVSHRTLRSYLKRLESNPPLEELLKLPDHLELIRAFREIPSKIAALAPSGEEDLRLLFLFRMAENPVLSLIHEEILREINQALVELIRKEPPEELDRFVVRTFEILKGKVRLFPWTALQCIKNLGFEILERGDPHLAEVFVEEVVKFGFQYPEIRGVDQEWHVLCNPAHLLNIRVWLEIFEKNPKWCVTLLSALIINLKLAGTCIRDTDLFQKDVTRLLNADIAPVYNLVKQFCRLLPVYFNEIGAEGRLRDVSTEIDEIYQRRDPLIHFLRKQSHVESSNLIVDFIGAIFRYWLTLDKRPLKPYLPPELWESLSPDSELTQEAHRATQYLFSALGIREPESLLEKDLEEIRRVLAEAPVSETERRRVLLLCEMYQLEHEKYSFSVEDLQEHLFRAKLLGFEGTDELLKALEDPRLEKRLKALLDYLGYLRDIILSPEKFPAREDIYLKRHIAADIPSMYGRYHEKKFDALGLSFRLEALARNYFEELSQTCDPPFITRATFFKILKYLELFRKALEIEGITSKKFDLYLQFLEVSLRMGSFTYTQYLDVFRGLLEGVKHIIKTYYVSPHVENLGIVLRQIPRRQLLPRYRRGTARLSQEEFIHRVTENFTRDLVASSFVLQSLDNFVTRIYQILLKQRERLNPRDLDLLMSYDPERALSDLENPNPLTRDLIHLGNKAYNLLLLVEEKLPVPPGFVITTEVFRCRPVIRRYREAYQDLLSRIEKQVRVLEERTGRRFGDPTNPLFLSVRSGAAITMPGMMSTILNLGSTPEIIEGLAERTGNLWFAWDTYRRFVQSWAMAQGLERELFNQLMRAHKRLYGVKKKREFSGEEMRELALLYRKLVESHGITIPDDPWEQLARAVDLIFDSWNARKARVYREIMGLSEDWGTAVIVQVMTFGNRGVDSGTGVLFTAPPYGKLSRLALWGDYTPGNQGEDIVSGLVNTYPISIEQRKREGREGPSLEEAFPEIYRALFEIAQHLVYEKGWSHQEMEFTFEGPRREDLYILQVRDMVTQEERPRIRVFENPEELKKYFLGRGIGVSGGALSGRVVFDLKDIERLRQEDPEAPLILLRYDTVPDDIKEISQADGLLTARGGQTSHAAIVASRLGKTCVVGCENLILEEDRKRARFNGRVVHLGEWISLDGLRGNVYLGKHPVREVVSLATT
ncbi:phosphoenolpyruvate synthase [Thermosulfurimonas marina]|uniref:Phosphoenolpyruvate synthase n=1 Tax=Thermosulfurimonas marina TaxID=2047767 RepID=A0A6H1WPZ6_9BACT|nr:PEP/pyruvate-binding domain-containing protein [Thermosulfurimonas marina]QJA05272.1 phosphoenolpyruvate synthase [Thermosulfurimonas marina]